MGKKLFLAITLLGAYLVGCSDSGSSSSSSPESSVETSLDSAHYTVVIYGTAEGQMDSVIEDAYKKVQPLLKNGDVRILVSYKYGVEYDKDAPEHFTGNYAKPGQLVTFELTEDLDLETIKKTAKMAGDSVLMSDEGLLSSVLDYAADSLPAENYILLFYGHGGGFDYDNDYPKDKRAKLVMKREQGQAVSAILYDEATTDYENGIQDGLSMYEIKREVENSAIKHLKAIFFHDCLMGNMEFLSEIYTLTDFIIASEHELAADEMLIVDFIKELTKEKNGFQEAVESFLDNTRPHWKIEYKEEGSRNGDLMLLKASEIESFFPIFKKIAKRLTALSKDTAKVPYIQYATANTYVVDPDLLFYDALDFANKLAVVTEDSVFVASAKELEKAFDKLILKKIETHYSEEQKLDSYSLSVSMFFHDLYNDESVWEYTNKEAYEYTKFHKETGWGNWLDVNTLYSYSIDEEDETEDGEEDEEEDAEEE